MINQSERVVSEVINRICNCRQTLFLSVIGNTGGELGGVYPNIRVSYCSDVDEVKDELLYIHIETEVEQIKIADWIQAYRDEKDIVIYDESGMLPLSWWKGERSFALEGDADKRIYVLGKSFDAKSEWIPPEDFRVLAIVHFYNEADIIGRTIEHLLEQELDVYLLDNWSDDGSYEIACGYKEKYADRIYLERFPTDGGGMYYEWYNQLRRTEEISQQMEYDWFIHYDADEMRISPWSGVSLRKAIYWIDMQGYNCIENTVIDFRMTEADDSDIFMKDTYFEFRTQMKWLDQVKTWKRVADVNLRNSGGHYAQFSDPRLFPLKILNRHYPLRSVEQAQKKVFVDRIPRFTKEKTERGWHGHYDRFKEIREFIFCKSDLLLWKEDTIDKYYLQLFMECGIHWRGEDISKWPEIRNQKIVVYGAGKIGRQVVQQELHKNQIVGWIDMDYKRLPMLMCVKTVSVAEIKNMKYDYVMVAVKDKLKQCQILESLKALGVNSNNILLYS